MVKKLSDTKVSKIFQLYFQGYSQTEIANKLKITQASVSIHVSKFKSLAEQQGIKAAAEEYGVMDEVQTLYDLAVDLKKAKITVEEAKTGLKMALVLQECGFEEEVYGDLIETCEKIKDEDYLSAAVELSQLEETYGMCYEDIVAEYKSTSKQLQQAQKELQDMHGKINSSNKELENINKQKQLANQDLKAHMDQIGVDMHKLKMVEALALALKEAAIPNQELPDYIQRQQLFNKAGVSTNLFAMIIEKVNVITSQDHGKKLFSLLSEYGSLSDTNKALQLQIESLTKQTAGLEQQAKLQGKIQGEIAKLKAEKASLEAYVTGLYEQKNELDHIKSEVNSLGKKKAELAQEVTKLEEYREFLINDIKSKEEKIGDIKVLESKTTELIQRLSEVGEKVKHDEKHLKIFKSFLGFVQSSSPLPELEKFAAVLPDLVDKAKSGKYSPELLRNHVLRQLIGPELQIVKCNSCQTRFNVDKQPQAVGYRCPRCLSSNTVVDKNALDILKKVLYTPKVQPKFEVQLINLPPSKPETKDINT